MFKLYVWIWTASCLFLLNGCASLQLQNNQPMDTNPESVIQDAEYWYQLGRGHQEKENYSEAVITYEKALELDPEDFRIYNAMGVVYSILGEDELAIQLIKEAINYKPRASHLHNNLGFAYLRWGRASEAAGAFHRALQLDPENKHARQNLKTAYEKLGCSIDVPCGQWQEPGQQ